MKKINLKGISEVLSEKELKNVTGGSGCDAILCNTSQDCWRGCSYCVPISNWAGKKVCSNYP